MNYSLLNNETEEIKYKSGLFKTICKILYKRDVITNNYYIEIYVKNDKIFEGVCKYKILQGKFNIDKYKPQENVIYLKKSKDKLFFNLMNSINIQNGIFHKIFYKKNDKKYKIHNIEKKEELKNGYNGKIITYNDVIYEGFFKYIKQENTINIFSVYLKKGKITYKNGVINEGIFNHLFLLDGSDCTYIYNNGDFKKGDFINGKFIKGNYHKKNVIQIGYFKNNKLYEGEKIYNNRKIIGKWMEDCFIGEIIYSTGIIYNGTIKNKKLINGFFIIPELYIYSYDIFSNNYELYYYSHLKTFKGVLTHKNVNNFVTRIYLIDDIYVNCFLDKNYFINLSLFIYNDNLNIFEYLLNNYNNNITIEYVNDLIKNFVVNDLKR